MKTSIQALTEAGQSAWLDNINRTLIESGQLKEMIDRGLRGLTSNPTIFEKAISSGDRYNTALTDALRRGFDTFGIYDELTVRDIRDAADAFLPVYESTAGLDGYVSLEINPLLAHKTAETIAEGKRLYAKVGRPNLMLKVPATEEGFPAVEEFLSLGMNVNVTLIFSLKQYADTVRAYLNGISRLISSGGNPRTVRSVASVFVSRFDTAADKMIDTLASSGGSAGSGELASLRGKAAVAHMSRIYALYRETFASEEFRKLKTAGASVQRVLWASTGTKDARYSDIKYVTELIAPDTVNTMPPQTFEAFLDHGMPCRGFTEREAESRETLRLLREKGIDIESIGEKLLRDGVQSFIDSFQALLSSIEKKSMQAQHV